MRIAIDSGCRGADAVVSPLAVAARSRCLILAPPALTGLQRPADSPGSSAARHPEAEGRSRPGGRGRRVTGVGKKGDRGGETVGVKVFVA